MPPTELLAACPAKGRNPVETVEDLILWESPYRCENRSRWRALLVAETNTVAVATRVIHFGSDYRQVLRGCFALWQFKALNRFLSS